MSTNPPGLESLFGRFIGGYRLDDILGVGATGAVFLGHRQDDTPRVVERTQALAVELPAEAAIKVFVLPWQLDDEERAKFRRRFLREAEMLAELHHPHILPIITYGTYGEDEATNFPYIILPYLSGGTLQGRLADHTQPLPLPEVERLLDQIASAVDYAHSQGVVHRDIKPGNILLDEQGEAYLSDFSIARLLDETHSRLTSTHGVMGTPQYMAPEQIAGRDVGVAVDIYSLGMVAYTLTTGDVAFSGPSTMEVMRLVAQEPPPPPRAQRPDLPEPAEAAILRALAKDPALRFPTAAAFAAAFAQGLRGVWTEGLMTGFVASAPHVTASSALSAAMTHLPSTSMTYLPSARRTSLSIARYAIRLAWKILGLVVIAVLVNALNSSGSIRSLPQVSGSVLPALLRVALPVAIGIFTIALMSQAVRRLDVRLNVPNTEPVTQLVVSTRTPKEEEEVVCTGFYPPELAHGESRLMLAYICLDAENTLRQMDEDAAERLPYGREMVRTRPTRGSAKVLRGSEFTLTPNLPGIRCKPQSARFRWDDDLVCREFEITPDTATTGDTVHGYIHVSHTVAQVPFSDIPVTIRIVAAAQPSVEAPEGYIRTKQSTYRSIFISYAHRDSMVVRWCKKQLERWTDDHYLIDYVELRSGRDWSQWIETEIRRADVFQLYWSKHANRSENVHKEIALALDRTQQIPHFIHPRYWSGRLYPLPSALEQRHPHAAKLPIPLWLHFALLIRRTLFWF